MDLSGAKSAGATERMDDRISRYVQRIEKLINRDRSRSPSPYNPRSKNKILTKGPMINRLDTYIKYEHSLYVLAKFMQAKDSFLVKVFFNELKGYQGHRIQQKIYRFVPIRVIQPDSSYVEENTTVIRENRKQSLLAFRVRNMYGRVMKEAFDIMRSGRGRETTLSKTQSNKTEKQSKKIALILFNSIFTRKLLKYQTVFFSELKRIRGDHNAPRVQNMSILRILNELVNSRLKVGLLRIKDKIHLTQKAQQNIKMIANKMFDKQMNIGKVKRVFNKLIRSNLKIKCFVRLISEIEKRLLRQSLTKLESQPKPKASHRLGLLYQLDGLFRLRLINTFNKIKFYRQNRTKLVQTLHQIVSKKNQIVLCKAFYILKSPPRQITEVKIQKIASETLSKHEKSQAALKFVQNFGGLSHLLELKYQYVVGQAFHQIRFVNQAYSVILKGFTNLRRCHLKSVFNMVRDYRKPIKSTGSLVNTNIRLLSKILKEIINRTQRPIFIKLLPISPQRKLKPPSAICLCRCLDRLYKRTIIPFYTKIRCHKTHTELSDTTDTTNIFNQVVQFLQDRHDNFQKIQQNYRKLKALAGYDEQQPQHPRPTDSRSVVLTLKTKILHG